MATIKDIARLSGYSIGTVSRVINHQKDVSEKARTEIEKVVRELDYHPNANAKLLKQTTASAVTVVIKGTSNIFLNSILERIQTCLAGYQEDVNIVFANESDNEVRIASRINRDNHPKGIIFLGADLDNFQGITGLDEVPLVIAAANGSRLGMANLSSFCTDDFAAGRCAGEAFLKHGHKKIAVIGGYDADSPEQVSSSRLQGLKEVLAENHVPFDIETQYIHSIFSMAGGYEAAGEIKEKCPDVTGVFCLSDLIAIGTMRRLQEDGLLIPGDISVIGFDGIEYSRFTCPRLVTIRQDVDAIARKSVDDLLRRIAVGGTAIHEKVPFQLENEESVADVRG